MVEIKTERLILKKLGHADKERLISLIGDFRVSGTLCGVPYPYTPDDADKWLKTVESTDFNLNIFLKTDLVGGIGLTPRDHGFHELGYWLGASYWGQGYATEAVGGFLDYLKTSTPYKKFKAGVQRQNTASAMVLEKNGFKQAGEGEEFSLSNEENVPTLNYEYHFRN
jgi:RimJ/RimL family protein N-acetyltransferase